MILESSGCADDNVRPFGESDGLGHHVHSSYDDGATNSDGGSEGFDLLTDLVGELTERGRRNERGGGGEERSASRIRKRVDGKNSKA